MTCRTTSLIVALAFLLVLPAVVYAVPEGIQLTWPAGAQGTVVFDGTVHAKKGLTCDACHINNFQTKKGADTLNMATLNREAFCGVCHNGKKAFSTKDSVSCKRCHKGSK
ncbi:MAG: multiheme c-type cytochrome [Nitrospiraceae bacterium]|nr:multiheme c-type cytochrome [Nitrospiraceae bacterium]